MKVLLVNGSPHANGSTYTALHEMEKVFTEEGIPREELGEQFVQWLRAKRIIEKIG